MKLNEVDLSIHQLADTTPTDDDFKAAARFALTALRRTELANNWALASRAGSPGAGSGRAHQFTTPASPERRQSIDGIG